TPMARKGRSTPWRDAGRGIPGWRRCGPRSEHDDGNGLPPPGLTSVSRMSRLSLAERSEVCMDEHHDSPHPGQRHAHGGKGHPHDRGALALLRYLRLLPRMWRSEVSSEIVRAIAPKSGERVVDLGAGMGAACVEAARTGATVVAVDPTPFMRSVLR